MIVKTQRSRLGLAVDMLLTAPAWIAFFYLFGSGIAAILRGAADGPQAPILPAFLPTMHTLLAYLAVALVNAALLYGWALYNLYSFRGLDRRRRAPPVGDERLARSFAIGAAQLATLRTSRVAVIHHDTSGGISAIERGVARLRRLSA